jgi:hypothetical protein
MTMEMHMEARVYAIEKGEISESLNAKRNEEPAHRIALEGCRRLQDGRLAPLRSRCKAIRGQAWIRIQ